MVFRKCPRHGWLKPSDYVEHHSNGRPICPVCQNYMVDEKESLGRGYRKNGKKFRRFKRAYIKRHS